MQYKPFAPGQRFFYFMAVLVLYAIPAVGQQNQQAQNEDAKPARIEGKVVSTTGELVPRAEIRLTPLPPQAGPTGNTSYTTETRDDGTFVINNITAPLSNLVLTARRPGYSVARFGASEPRAPVALFSLAAGQVRKDMVVTMIAQGVVSGKVTSEEGDPIQDAEVYVLRYDYTNRQKHFQTEGRGRTNDLGEYRIAAIPPGRYFLMASDSQDPGNDEVWLSTFYPDTTDALAAAPVQIIGGQELPRIDIQLARRQGYTVSGKIVGVSAGPAVMLRSAQEAGAEGGLGAMSAKFQAAQVNPDGTFTFHGILSGPHVIQAVVQGGEVPLQSAGQFSVTVEDHDISDLVLPLTDGINIAGSVRFEEDSVPDIGGLRVSLHREKGVPILPILNVPVEADGTFSFKHVASGEFSLELPTLPGIYIKSVRMNGTDVTGSHLNLNTSGTMEIVLGQNAPKLTGVVRNGKGEAQGGMMVFLSPEKPNDSLIYGGTQVTSTDVDGAFTIETVAPGTHYAVAIEPLDILPWVAREFPELLRGKAAKVEVSGGGVASVDLELIPTTEVMRAAEKAP